MFICSSLSSITVLPAIIIFAIIFSFYPSPMGARIYLLSFSLDFVAVELDTTISHQKSLSKAIKTTKNHHFFPLCLRYRWGVAKTKNSLLFSVPGSSWFIYTPTKKLNRLKNKKYCQKSKNPIKSPLSHHSPQKSKYRP